MNLDLYYSNLRKADNDTFILLFVHASDETNSEYRYHQILADIVKPKYFHAAYSQLNTCIKTK